MVLARGEAIAESIAPDDVVRRPSHKWDIAPTAHTDAIAVAMGLADPQAIPKSPMLDGLLHAERQCSIHGGCQFSEQWSVDEVPFTSICLNSEYAGSRHRDEGN